MTSTWGERTFDYTLRLQPRRDLVITVHPDLRVEVLAPESKPLERVLGRIQAKRSWIARQLQEFEGQQPLAPHQFVPGESCWYLGKQYRLRVERAGEGVTLQGGRLVVRVSPKAGRERVQAAMAGWYRTRAREVFERRALRLQRESSVLGGLEWTLRVREMKRRWGSCTVRGTITLNPALVQVAPSCIDYVIVHELVHLIEPRHSPRFYRLLGRVMPDWRQRRERLASVGYRAWADEPYSGSGMAK
jgi:predicted metal-dependent hydrolase